MGRIHNYWLALCVAIMVTVWAGIPAWDHWQQGLQAAKESQRGAEQMRHRYGVTQIEFSYERLEVRYRCPDGRREHRWVIAFATSDEDQPWEYVPTEMPCRPVPIPKVGTQLS